jgi:hypothetical protein
MIMLAIVANASIAAVMSFMVVTSEPRPMWRSSSLKAVMAITKVGFTHDDEHPARDLYAYPEHGCPNSGEESGKALRSP